MNRRLRSELGQATVEFAGAIWIVLFVALAAWQLSLAGWSAVGAANAARTAARAYSRVSDAAQAVTDGKMSLQNDGLGAGSSVEIDPPGAPPGTAKVVVKIPIVFPGLASPIPITETADMPPTG